MDVSHSSGCRPPCVDLDWAEAMLCSAIELGRRVQDKSILRVPQNQELQLLQAAHPSGVRGLTPNAFTDVLNSNRTKQSANTLSIRNALMAGHCLPKFTHCNHWCSLVNGDFLNDMM